MWMWGVISLANKPELCRLLNIHNIVRWPIVYGTRLSFLYHFIHWLWYSEHSKYSEPLLAVPNVPTINPWKAYQMSIMVLAVSVHPAFRWAWKFLTACFSVHISIPQKLELVSTCRKLRNFQPYRIFDIERQWHSNTVWQDRWLIILTIFDPKRSYFCLVWQCQHKILHNDILEATVSFFELKSVPDRLLLLQKRN